MKRSLFVLLCGMGLTATAQEKVVVPTGGANASAQIIKKRICFREEGSNKPLTGIYFTVVRDHTPFGGAQSDSCGCSFVRFTMSNYYANITVNLNDNTYMRPDWKERRNTENYLPVNTAIRFKNKGGADTTFIYLKHE